MRRLITLTLLLLGAFYAADSYLPARAIDPWGLVVPRKIVLIFLAILSVQALGAIAVRLFGHRRGLLVSSMLGGFVSSTAVTVAMARASKSSRSHALSSSVVAATLAMVVEAAFIVFVATPALFWKLMPLWVGTLSAGVALGVLSRHRDPVDHLAGADIVSFRPWDALKLTMLLATMLSVVFAAKVFLGKVSLVAVSFLGALFELHGIVFAQVSLPDALEDGGRGASFIILVALSAALLSKAGLAYVLGSRPFARRVALAMGAMALAAWVSFAFS